MPDTYFSLIAKHIPTRSIVIKKGEYLFSQGDYVTYMFYLTNGTVKLNRYTIDGIPVILHIANSQETIAEASLFSDNYHCSAIAMTKLEIKLINKKQFLSYIENNTKIMRQLLQIFSKQILELRTMNEIKNIVSAKERIIIFLHNQMDDNHKIWLNISMKDMASKIGIAHETFYRELKKLEKSGIISRQDRYIEILATT